MIHTDLDQTNVSPSEEKDPSVEQIPDALFENAATVDVQFKLFLGKTFIGYLGVTDNGWCDISSTAATFSKVVARRKTYYQLINNKTKFNKRWLNAQRNGVNKRLGIYRKYLRSSFTLKGTELIWDVNGNPISIIDQATGRLYANSGDKFTTLVVEEISA